MPTVSAIYTEARGLLNDVGASVFTDAALLPLIKKAYQELQDELVLNGLSEVKEEDFSTNVAANTKSITSATYPADLIMPITLWEKPQGSSDDQYTLMLDRAWSADEIQTDELRQWKWQENEIKLIGANTARTVKIKYLKFLAVIVDTSTNIPIINCQTFLASRLAAIAAFCIGANPERAAIHDADAEKRLGKIIATLVKRHQANPSRRQPFKAHS